MSDQNHNIVPTNIAPKADFFPAKILLFGEHTVIQGSQALASPLWCFGGTWRHAPDGASRQFDLPNWLVFLEKLKNEGKIALNTEGVADALKQGLFFDSNVPNGYGAGSSGALVAALFARFTNSQPEIGESNSLVALRKTFGLMESYFHGSSSGFDPLVSFVRQPVHIRRDQTIHISPPIHTNLTIFLLDTKMSRKAEPIIKIFQEKLLTPQYKSLITNELIPRVDEAIAALMTQQEATLFDAVHQISFFQHRFFPEAIPLPFQNLWLDGLSSDFFKLKLCGAGGGGFILGFSKNWAATHTFFSARGFSAFPIDL
jgi:mevalonate kinase